MRTSVLAFVSMVAIAMSHAQGLPEGYWESESAKPILDKTLTIHLSPDLSALSEGEQAVVSKLLQVGAIFQDLYEHSRHHQALQAKERLITLHDAGVDPHRTKQLLDLYRLFRGPIVTTLNNERTPFLPVDPFSPGKNVYPVGLTQQAMDAYFKTHPEARARLLYLRGVVRRAKLDAIKRDLGTLSVYPVLDTLHPGLKSRLVGLAQDVSSRQFYAVPYSVAYPEQIQQAFRLLSEAADDAEGDDLDLARYLRSRARDLLADNYDGSDAAWITGRFKNLNALIGSYETYDDELYGVKSFFALSLLLRDRERSDKLRDAIGGIQEIEDNLPYSAHKRIRDDIPVGVYSVIADFGQARGTNTATILPNESHLARQYGRTILLRANIMTHPDLHETSRSVFEAAVDPDHHGDFAAIGNFERTLWHEIGHYLGVDRTTDGRDLGDALEANSDLIEEMKSDLVSLFAVPALRGSGYYDEKTARAVYASGIRRVLQKNKPRREQPYQMMQLIQWNFFLEQGLLSYDPGSQTIRIHYERYPEAVRSLLKIVLDIQHRGDNDLAEQFIEKYAEWDDTLHGAVANKIKSTERYRYRLVYYGALGE